MVSRKNFTRQIVCLFAVIAACGGYVVNLHAQEKSTSPSYDRLEIDPALRLKKESEYTSRKEFKLEERRIDTEIHRLKSLTKKVLKGDTDFGPNRDALDRYLGRYFLPRMTHYDDMSVSAGKLRDDLVRNYLNKTFSAQARDHVLDNIIYPFATKVVEGNYHPASRINAMYLIGSLNRREGVRRESLPRLMTESLTYMIGALDKADLPDYLKVAALHGIARHVGIDQEAQKQINGTTRNSIRDRMLKLVQQPYAGKKNEDDLLYFQQRLATQILGELHDPGTTNAVGNQLKSMIANEKLRLWLRVDAVAAFGKINFASDDESAKLIQMMINDSVKLVAQNARQQSVIIKKDLRVLRENYLVYTGKDLAKIGVEQSTSRDEIERVNPGAETGFEVQSKKETPAELAELPTYRLNIARRRFKTVCEKVATSLAGSNPRQPSGLTSRQSKEEAKKTIQQVIAIRAMMRHVDRSIFQTNRKNKDQELSKTEKLHRALARAADRITDSQK